MLHEADELRWPPSVLELKHRSTVLPELETFPSHIITKQSVLHSTKGSTSDSVSSPRRLSSTNSWWVENVKALTDEYDSAAPIQEWTTCNTSHQHGTWWELFVQLRIGDGVNYSDVRNIDTTVNWNYSTSKIQVCTSHWVWQFRSSSKSGNRKRYTRLMG